MVVERPVRREEPIMGRCRRQRRGEALEDSQRLEHALPRHCARNGLVVQPAQHRAGVRVEGASKVAPIELDLRRGALSPFSQDGHCLDIVQTLFGRCTTRPKERIDRRCRRRYREWTQRSLFGEPCGKANRRDSRRRHTSRSSSSKRRRGTRSSSRVTASPVAKIVAVRARGSEAEIRLFLPARCGSRPTSTTCRTSSPSSSRPESG